MPPLLGVKAHSAGKNEMNREVVGGLMISALVCILQVFGQDTLLSQEWTSHHLGVLDEFSPGGFRDVGEYFELGVLQVRARSANL